MSFDQLFTWPTDQPRHATGTCGDPVKSNRPLFNGRRSKQYADLRTVDASLIVSATDNGSTDVFTRFVDGCLRWQRFKSCCHSEFRQIHRNESHRLLCLFGLQFVNQVKRLVEKARLEQVANQQ